MSLKIQLPAVQAQASEVIGGGVPRAMSPWRGGAVRRDGPAGRLTRARHPDGALGEAKLPRRADDSRRRALLEEGGARGREDLDLGHVARLLRREDFGAARRHTALELAARGAGGAGEETGAPCQCVRVGWGGVAIAMWPWGGGSAGEEGSRTP